MKLEDRIDELTAQVLSFNTAREQKQDFVELRHETEVYFSRDKVRKAAIALNLADATVFLWLLCNFLVRSVADYENKEKDDQKALKPLARKHKAGIKGGRQFDQSILEMPFQVTDTGIIGKKKS